MKISVQELRNMIKEAVAKKLQEQHAAGAPRAATGQLPTGAAARPVRSPSVSTAGPEAQPGAVQTDRKTGRVVAREGKTMEEMVREMVKEALKEQTAGTTPPAPAAGTPEATPPATPPAPTPPDPKAEFRALLRMVAAGQVMTPQQRRRFEQLSRQMGF